MRRLTALLAASACARRLLIAAMLGLAVAGTTAACGIARPADLAAEATSFSPEGEALAAMGFDPQDIAVAEPAFAAAGQAAAAVAPDASATPAASGAPGKSGGKLNDWRKRRALRVILARNTLHGEAVVRTKDGQTVTIAVQRGVITELTDTTVTVKSSDGFVLKWTFGDKLRVVEKRKTVQSSDVKVGMEIGVAGAKDGDAATARFILIPSGS